MNFIIEFSVDNAAFTEGNRRGEIIRILEKIVDDMKHNEGKDVIRDINGNKIGVIGFRM